MKTAAAILLFLFTILPTYKNAFAEEKTFTNEDLKSYSSPDKETTKTPGKIPYSELQKMNTNNPPIEKEEINESNTGELKPICGNKPNCKEWKLK